MGFYNPTSNCHTETSTLCFCREEWLEYVLRASGVSPGPLSRTPTSIAEQPFNSTLRQEIRMTTGSLQAANEFSNRLRNTCVI